MPAIARGWRRHLARDASLRLQLDLIGAERQEAIAANEALRTPSAGALDRLMASLPQRRPSLAERLGLSRLNQAVADFFAAPSVRGVRFAAVAAALLLLVQAAVITTLLVRGDGGATYQTASGQSDDKGVSALVVFAEDARLPAISRLLADLDATIVDGPKPGGVYKVRIRTVRSFRRRVAMRCCAGSPSIAMWSARCCRLETDRAMRYAPLKGCLAACAAFLVLPLADVLAATSKGPSEPAQLSVPKKKKAKDKTPPKTGPSLVGPKKPGTVGPKIPDRVTKPYPPDKPRPDTGKPGKPSKPLPEIGKPGRPDIDKPGKPRPEIGKPERPRPDPGRPDGRRPEIAEPERPRIPPRVFIPEPGPERERYLTSVPRRSERGPPRPLPALEQAVSRQLVVLINQDQPASVEADLAGQYGLDQLGTEAIPLLAARVALFRIRDRRPEQQVIAAMTGDGRVREVQLNYRYRRQAGPAGPAAACRSTAT